MKYHSLTFLVIYILLPLVLKKIFKIPDLKSLSSKVDVWTSSETVSIEYFSVYEAYFLHTSYNVLLKMEYFK